MNLHEAWNSTQGFTDNGMATNLSSLRATVDFFFLAGASRGKDIRPTFVSAMGEDLDVAIRTLLWARDVRGGAGERGTFRNLLSYLATGRTYEDRQVVPKLIPLVPVVGRWDDLLVLNNTPFWSAAVAEIRKGLEAGNGLCAKWMPRKGRLAADLRNSLGMTPKQYRKTLVNLTKVVETQMCANEWDKIEYPHVPSLAQIRYKTAFQRHDPEGYAAYVAAVEKGEAKVNAGAVFPHDIVKNLGPLSDKQWEALPNFMADNKERVLPVCDVSASMYGLPMDVSIALGLYISERNEGPFKDTVVTFNHYPTLVKLKAKGLAHRVQELADIEWGGNTDLTLTFEAILETAQKLNLPEEEMPTMVLIISDMEFDEATGNYSWARQETVIRNEMAMEMIRDRYTNAGYAVPKVVLWNVNGRPGNSPVTYKEDGTALISGFSPAILTSVLGDMEQFTPQSVMLQTVMNERYRWQ